VKFEDLGLCKEILLSINNIGYIKPTEIQKKAIPNILIGRDILGCAQTGTGKTGSFIMPLIEILNSGKSKSRMPRSLVLAPTRELAMQVSEEFDKINQNSNLQMALLIGGTSFLEQESKLSKGVDVLIATPGRLLDHIERGKVLIKDIKLLVIDEADRMLDMGFIPDIIKINKLLPKIRQTLFFSATLSDEIRNIGKDLLINPKEITINPYSSTSENIVSTFIKTNNKNKMNDLKTLLYIDPIKSAVIFCNKKNDINKISNFLKKNNFNTVSLHGDMNQNLRIRSLKNFKDKSAKILIASDVAARGIDIDGLSHVFNFDVPNNPEDYVHRIGRTGRAGKKGKAYTLYDENDNKTIISIEKLINKKVNKTTISIKNKNKSKDNHFFLPEENYLNFKESGKIPDFLSTK
jgi:superfamily II DNA/RNA helicase